MKPTGRYLRDGSQCPTCLEESSISDHGKTGFHGSRGRKIFVCNNPQCPTFACTAFWINCKELTKEEYVKWVRYTQLRTK